MKKLICAALISGAVIVPVAANSGNVLAAQPSTELSEEYTEMPNVIGDQYQRARDGLTEYFYNNGIKANVIINFVKNTDRDLSFKVCGQGIPADTAIKSGSSIDIDLDVYGPVEGQQLPLEKDEVEMPLVIGEQFQHARDELPKYFYNNGIKASVIINFVKNTDRNLSFKVCGQSIPGTAGVKIGSSIDITLDVYGPVEGQQLPLEADEIGMPNVIGDDYDHVKEELPKYFLKNGIKATVNANYIKNTDPSLTSKIANQDIPAEAGVKIGSSVNITLDVYAEVEQISTPEVKPAPATTKPEVTQSPSEQQTKPETASNENVSTEAASNEAADENQDKVTSFVDRLYSDVLGRTPDDEGSAYWTKELKDLNISGAEVARCFILSDEYLGSVKNEEEFVTTLYSAFFNREPDKEGLAYWTKSLKDQTMTKEEVANGFILSNEWAATCAEFGIRAVNTPADATRAFVERMYTTALNRDSDENGLAYWTQQLSDKAITGEQVGMFFFLSDEMASYKLDSTEYVTRLYKTFMDRDPEADGLAYWVSELEGGADPASIICGFARSEEFSLRCAAADILPC